jgi:tetratricopeptide (TPR) repeat protein
VHRDLKNLDTAQQLLSRVERTAEALQDEHLRALALNQRGKIANTAGKPDEARAYFAQARQRFERQDDPRLHDPEMVAVVDRNEGKVELDQEVFGKALDLFERSMHRFQDLQLQVEEAETANLHAQALARLGEFEEAELEYHWARSIMEELGAGVRHVEFTTTAQLLARKPRG